MGGKRHTPAAFPPGMTRRTLYRRLGKSQGRSGKVRKISSHRDSIPGPTAANIKEEELIGTVLVSWQPMTADRMFRSDSEQLSAEFSYKESL